MESIESVLTKEFMLIPSIKRLGDLEVALAGKNRAILLTGADIANLKPLAEKVHAAGKGVLVNMELLGGFGRDQVGIKLLKNYYGVDGVMSTDSSRLGMARHAGLYTIQRFLISDSRALDTSTRILKGSAAHAAEILPAAIGVMVIKDLRRVTAMPLLAGGFIRTPSDLAQVQAAGFDGATISRRDLY
jgi:glycerol uptake operon antiterminator